MAYPHMSNQRHNCNIEYIKLTLTASWKVLHYKYLFFSIRHSVISSLWFQVYLLFTIIFKLTYTNYF